MNVFEEWQRDKAKIEARKLLSTQIKEIPEKMITTIVGMKFGRLTVVSKGDVVRGHYMYLCKCDCGNEKNIRAHSLKTGMTKSCGCLKRELDLQRYAENRVSMNEFISRSVAKHGNKYDYSKVNYINNATKVDIICASHGIFKQEPMVHWRQSGCPLCALDRFNKENKVE